MNPSFLFGFAILIISFHEVRSANILFVYTGGTYSHETGIVPLATALAYKGHKISFLSAFSRKSYIHPSVEILTPKLIVDNMANYFHENRVTTRLNGNERKIWFTFPVQSVHICKLLLESSKDDVLNDLFHTNRTFDLVIMDASVNECAYIIAYYFNAKIIASSSTTVRPWHYDIFGLPDESSWIPVMSSQFNYPMSFVDRVQNFIEPFVWTYTRYFYMYPEMENIMKKFLMQENIPRFIDLERNTSLVFLNTHPSLDLPRSLPPQFVNIGGMKCWDTEKQILTEEMADFLDEAESDAVLISFGSALNTADMPRKIITEFFKVFEHFQHIRFLWKWSGPKPKNCPKNVILAPWLPQMEILGHPSVKAFVTHCGLNSLMEATFHGVPLVGIPIFGDQDLNAYRMQVQEYGIRVEVREMDANILISALSSVLKEPKYKDNMGKMSIAFRDRPLNPIETAVYWVEYVLRTEDMTHLRPKNLHQSLFKRRSMDVIYFMIALSIITIACICYVSLLIVTKLYNKTTYLLSDAKFERKKHK